MKIRKVAIPCDGLPDGNCRSSATVFFRTEGIFERRKYIARCPYHEAVPRSAGLEEISREVYIIAQVMDS